MLALAALAIAVTSPFVLHPASTLTAPLGGDVSGSIAKYGAIVREGVTPFSSGRLVTIGAPDGVPLTPGTDLVSFLSSGPLWLASLTIGPIAAHGLMSLLGLALTAIVTFLFVRSITRSASAGLVAACAYGFFPHEVLIARAAQTYTHMWLFILPLWAFTRLAQCPDRRRALVAGLSGLPAIFWTPYFTLHVLVEMLALGVAVLVLVALREGVRQALVAVGIAAIPVAAGLVAYLAVGLGTDFAEVPTRAPEDAYAQSAHPLMYLLPGAASWAWGTAPTETLVDVVPRAAGTNLYLGVSVVALAVCGLAWLAVRGRRALRRPRPPDGEDDVASAAGTAAVLAGASVLLTIVWSLPPTIDVLGLSISTPSRLTVELVPSLRAGQRFVMVVMAGVAVLAGIGAWWLLSRVPRRVAPVLGVLLAAVVLADLAVDPANRSTRVPHSAALAALRAAPPARAIHYYTAEPQGLLRGPSATPCVYQLQHDKPLLNSCNFPITEATFYRLVAVGDPASCTAAVFLPSQLAIRYVIVDAGIDPFPGCPGQPRVLAADRDFTVLEFGAPESPPREDP